MQITTGIKTIDTADPLITGEEDFPIVGNLLNKEQLKEIFNRCIGIRRNWSCIDKAIEAQNILGFGVIEIGSMLIWNKERTGNFGFYFEPPFECHAWLRTEQGIIDVALPGVIELGLAYSDERGHILENLQPFVLAGEAPDWIEYEANISLI